LVVNLQPAKAIGHEVPADSTQAGSLDKKLPPLRGMVSAFLCDRSGHGSARLLAIFRRKLCVAILLLVVG
jgi:hypothetical protein